MLKKVLVNSLLGIVVGTFIGLMISIIFSYLSGTGYYYPSTPAFVHQFDNQATAMLVAMGLWSCMGAVASVLGLIFDGPDWSITKMTVVHCLLCYISFVSIAILAGWIGVHWIQIGIFTIIYIIIYVIIWFATMTSTRKQIEKMNQTIELKEK